MNSNDWKNTGIYKVFYSSDNLYTLAAHTSVIALADGTIFLYIIHNYLMIIHFINCCHA